MWSCSLRVARCDEPFLLLSTETIIFCGTDPDGVAPLCRRWLPRVGHINLIATMGIIFSGTDCGDVVFLFRGGRMR